jgi:hypothetical protein
MEPFGRPLVCARTERFVCRLDHSAVLGEPFGAIRVSTNEGVGTTPALPSAPVINHRAIDTCDERVAGDHECSAETNRSSSSPTDQPAAAQYSADRSTPN